MGESARLFQLVDSGGHKPRERTVDKQCMRFPPRYADFSKTISRHGTGCFNSLGTVGIDGD